jgi:hypothetical protein
MTSSPHLPRPALVNTRAIPRQATSAVAFTQPDFPDDDPLLDFFPFIHPAPRRNSITPPVQRAFILELAATGTVKAAATRVGHMVDARLVKPGHWLYDRIRYELTGDWGDEEEEEEAEG